MTTKFFDCVWSAFWFSFGALCITLAVWALAMGHQTQLLMAFCAITFGAGMLFLSMGLSPWQKTKRTMTLLMYASMIFWVPGCILMIKLIIAASPM